MSVQSEGTPSVVLHHGSGRGGEEMQRRCTRMGPEDPWPGGRRGPSPRRRWPGCPRRRTSPGAVAAGVPMGTWEGGVSGMVETTALYPSNHDGDRRYAHPKKIPRGIFLNEDPRGARGQDSDAGKGWNGKDWRPPSPPPNYRNSLLGWRSMRVEGGPGGLNAEKRPPARF